MNTRPSDAPLLAAQTAEATREESQVVRVVCPPFVALRSVADALAGTGVAVGAQNVHSERRGAFTGEVSGEMLEGLASWCIVGHSERRRDQCESDELIGRKLLRCREHALRPILCVGEQLADREAGRAEETVRAQLEGAFAVLSGIDPLAPGEGRRGSAALDPPVPRPSERPVDESTRRGAWLVVAYEPVWAIGTGRTARGSDAAAMADAIRRVVGEHGWSRSPDEVAVLYGGSVTSATIGEFLVEPGIDGALVGGASLRVDEMAGIVARAGMTARARRGAGTLS